MGRSRRDELLEELAVDELTDEEGLRVFDIMGERLLEQRARRPRESAGSAQLRREGQDRLVRGLPQRTPDGETTRGRRLRIAFLPRNKLFLKEVSQARTALGIPEGEISMELEGPRWETYLAGLEGEQPQDILKMDPERRKGVALSDLVGAFLFAHERAYLEAPERPEVLPDDLYELAAYSATAFMGDREIPDWLRPRIGEVLRRASPIRRAVCGLLERHRLPQHAWVPVELFLLTEDTRHLMHFQELEIRLRPSSGAVENKNAFDVLIKGVDEFTTKTEWERIWDIKVKPEIDRIWSLRGQKPSGNRALTKRRVERYFDFWCDRKVRGWDFDTAYKKTSLDLDDALPKTVREADREIDIAFSPVDLRDEPEDKNRPAAQADEVEEE